MREPSTHDPDRNIEDVRYERRVLYFVDILGFRDLIDNRTAADVFRVIKGFLDETINFMKIPGVTFTQAQTHAPTFYFSDLVVTIVDYNIKNKLDLFAALGAAINRLSRIQLYLLSHHGILIRGSIVCDDVFVDTTSNIIYGPALVEAYQLESRLIVYPRIGISRKIITELGGDQLFSSPLPSPYDPSKLDIFTDDEALDERAIITVVWIHNLMRKDKDGLYFVDYLRVAFHLEEEESYYYLMFSHMSKCQEHIFRKYQACKSGRGDLERIKEKVLWVIAYHNEEIDRVCALCPTEELKKEFANLYIHV